MVWKVWSIVFKKRFDSVESLEEFIERLGLSDNSNKG